jgi:hypothetical protein
LPAVRRDQLAPPSLVVATVPLSPTLEQVVELAQLIPEKVLERPVSCPDHEPPPLADESTVPESPAAKQVVSAGQLTARSGLPCGTGLCQAHVPVPVVTNAEADVGVKTSADSTTAVASTRLQASLSLFRRLRALATAIDGYLGVFGLPLPYRRWLHDTCDRPPDIGD